MFKPPKHAGVCVLTPPCRKRGDLSRTQFEQMAGISATFADREVRCLRDSQAAQAFSAGRVGGFVGLIFWSGAAPSRLGSNWADNTQLALFTVGYPGGVKVCACLLIASASHRWCWARLGG